MPAQKELLKYAKEAVKPFEADWPEELVHRFDLKEARKLLAKKTEEESGAWRGWCDVAGVRGGSGE